MKCDVCDKEATVFLTQIINGQMTTVNLCESCSKAKGVTDELGFGLADAFMGTSSTTSVGSAAEACPTCGFTADQLKKIGRMGCPDCYDAFRPNLDPMLSAMHKGTRHVGKQPTHLLEESKGLLSLKDLRTSLDEAVAEERYEEAADLKKQIDALEQKMQQETAS